jgi:putative heme-binding domain-containing protein
MNMELDALNHSQDDPIIGRVVWQNSLPIAQTTRQQVLKRLTDRIEQPDDLLRSMLPRFAGKWIDDAIANRSSQKEVQDLLSELLNAANKLKKVSPDNAAAALRPIFARLQSIELTLPTIEPVLKKFRAENPSPDWGQWNSEKLTANEKEWNKSELILGLIAGEDQPQKIAEGLVLDRTTAILLRQELLNYVSIRDRKLATKALLFAIDQSVEANQPRENDKKWLNFAIELGGVELTDVDLEQLGSKVSMLAPGEQAALAEKMSQREPAASGLLAWIRDGKLRKELLSPNRIRLLAANGSDQAKSTISKIYGTVRLDDDPERERVVKRISEQAKGMRGGDAARGWLVYDRICGQCHIMHNRGVEVGPNITANGRGNFEQLLVSIFNPSLVIGDAYRSVTIRTDDDTVLTGLLVSRDATKTVVRTQGGKEVTVLAQNIESFQQDKKSLMPEGIESQLSDAELADLLALLSLEKPPGSSDNSTILATPGGLHGK